MCWIFSQAMLNKPRFRSKLNSPVWVHRNWACLQVCHGPVVSTSSCRTEKSWRMILYLAITPVEMNIFVLKEALGSAYYRKFFPHHLQGAEFGAVIFWMWRRPSIALEALLCLPIHPFGVELIFYWVWRFAVAYFLRFDQSLVRRRIRRQTGSHCSVATVVSVVDISHAVHIGTVLPIQGHSSILKVATVSFYWVLKRGAKSVQQVKSTV